MVKKESPKKMSWTMKTVLISISAAFLLLLANSAVWVNQYMFNSANFAQVATDSITSDSSRKAIAGGITNKLLSDRPVANNLVGDTVTNVISGVLATEQANKAFNTVVSRTNEYLTSSNQESIAIDLSGVKGFLTKVVDAVSNFREVKVDPAKIPNEIVLVDEQDVPDLHNTAVAFLWLGPIALLSSIALFAFPYLKNREQYKSIMMIQGSIVFVTGLLALLIGPLFRPIVLSNIEGSSARTVVTNLYNAFVQTFNNQTSVIIIVGFVTLLIGSGLTVYNRYQK